MPLHSFFCDSCSHQFDQFQSLDGLREYERCPKCNLFAQKHFFKFPMATVRPDIAYRSPVTGEPITSSRARAEDLARHNCIEYDPEMKTDLARRQKASDERLEKAIDRAVDSTLAEWPAHKKEKLQAELEGGLTVQAERNTPQQTAEA